MICQACHDAMPFKLSDGTPYFEMPEVLGAVSEEFAENHLALCPNCSAKWRYANETPEAEVHNAILTSEQPEMDVVLAGGPVKVRFVRIHFDDLRVILNALKKVPA